MFAGNLFAQQHLSFKGVPIDGTLKEYTNAMIKAGFQYEGTTPNGSSMLTGDFAGYKGCTIGVSTMENLDVVSHIAVLFPDNDTWTAVLSDYESLKSMLTEKYGYPTDSKEIFTGYIGDYHNGLIMHALKDGEYEWYTSFSTELGYIRLSITSGIKYHTAAVTLVYFDKINSDKIRQSAMDDL